MKTKEEAKVFFLDQLSVCDQYPKQREDLSLPIKNIPQEQRTKFDPVHYGKFEVYGLLDFIYGDQKK